MPLPFKQIHTLVQSLLPSHDNKLLSLVKSQSFKEDEDEAEQANQSWK